jgi:short-subunit dehydrogenase
MDQAFSGKVVIVTGGTSGIGREIVLQLAGYGARLYICARNQKRGRDLVKLLQDGGLAADFQSVDVQDPQAVEAYVAHVLEEEGRIDYLFHAAGIILGGEIRDHKPHQIRELTSTNVLGTAHVSYFVYRAMAEQGSGHIINFGSAAGLFPVPLMGYYGASKFYVLGLTEALRQEGRSLGVRASTVAPGIVDTPIYETGFYSKTDKPRIIRYMKKKPQAMQPDKAARRILRGVVRNRPVIFTQQYPRFSWLLYRLLPGVYRYFGTRTLAPYRRKLRIVD